MPKVKEPQSKKPPQGNRLAKKAKKPEPSKARDVIYPELQVRLCTAADKQSITAEVMKTLLGWQEEGEEKFGDDYLLVDEYGKKVRCLNVVNNRPFDDDHSRKLAQDILTRNWADSRSTRDGEPPMTINGETFVLTTTGRVDSGQHRGAGLVRAAQMWSKDPYWRKFWPDGEPSIEGLIVVGVSENKRVTRTLDNVKPRSVADVLSTDSEFGRGLRPSDRRTVARMAESAIKMIWDRTGRPGDAYASRLSNSEACSFLDRHPRLAQAVRHVWEEYQADWRRSTQLLGAGYASGLCYLMAATESDPKAYAADRAETSLDLSAWDKAQEFWTLVCSGSSAMVPLVQAMAALYSEDGEARPSLAEKVGTVVKAWNEFYAGSLTLANLKLKYSPPDDEGHVRLVEFPSVGGIDLGESRVQDDEEDAVNPDKDDGAEPSGGTLPDGGDPAAAAREEKKRRLLENRASRPIVPRHGPEARPQVDPEVEREMAELRERYPGSVIIFRSPTGACVQDSDAPTVSKVAGLKVQRRPGWYNRVTIGLDQVEDVVSKLISAGHRVAISERNGTENSVREMNPPAEKSDLPAKKKKQQKK